MRQLVGPEDPAAFDNPTGGLVFPFLEESAYESVFDFACGCGRIARQLLQQNPRPRKYVGLDIHRRMIEWNQRNLSSVDPNFEFHHHDVFNLGHAPENTRRLTAPFEVPDASFTLVVAWSIFTHLYEVQVLHYLREIARIMRPEGQLLSTWFLFDKREFPMMQAFQNTLFINEIDPTNATIFDRQWLLEAIRETGFSIIEAVPPSIRGYQWRIRMVHRKESEAQPFQFPVDDAPYGSMPPPLLPTPG